MQIMGLGKGRSEECEREKEVAGCVYAANEEYASDQEERPVKGEMPDGYEC